MKLTSGVFELVYFWILSEQCETQRSIVWNVPCEVQRAPFLHPIVIRPDDVTRQTLTTKLSLFLIPDLLEAFPRKLAHIPTPVFIAV
ncbi:hypothetical protein C1H46_016386 [Malus baccata]|uniref:Uncharacterized protein n=1 Tax=Malus baccata TaxID=106549 RepID=A0A540MIN6_MALBA|nr:hypothetical protein C1H46_016386 [Malus baccata]